MKFKNKDFVYIRICDNNDFYDCGDGYYGDFNCYCIREINKNNCFVHSDISISFDIDDPKTFTESCFPTKFTTKRVIVIEMN